MQKMQITRRWK